MAKLLTCGIKNSSQRKSRRNELIKGYKPCEKLILTLLVKDEEDIIENNILFHKGMGVDGIIVTDNNSSDNTMNILKKYKEEGIILDIINEPEDVYMQSKWVDRMIKLAINKYHADWVINADADEFWYSNSLNLKKSIRNLQNYNSKVNVIYPIHKNFIPLEEKTDFINSPYFVQHGFADFEQKNFSIKKFGRCGDYTTKVIHATKGYVQIAQGNHAVDIKKPNIMFSNGITIYHYFVRNYKYFEKKAISGGQAYLNHPDKKMGIHWREWYNEYQKGNLYKVYKEMFDLDKSSILLEHGIIAKDTSVINFLNYIREK